jgi:hypothetical protein
MKSESLSRATTVLRTHRCWRHRFECGGKEEGGGAGDGGGVWRRGCRRTGSGLARAMVTAPYVKLGFWGLWPVPIEEAVALPQPQAGRVGPEGAGPSGRGRVIMARRTGGWRGGWAEKSMARGK